MKKYYSIACALFSVLSFAQQTISFESMEGFISGDIQGQAGWISTPTGGMPAHVENQTITTDKASDGYSALKIVKEPVYGTQTDPVIGGFYNLPAPFASAGFSVSFDINISQLGGSVFGFQGVNSIDDQFVVRVDFDKTGIIKVLSTTSGVPALVSATASWSPNVWNRLKVVGTSADIRYYLNDVLIYQSPAVNYSAIDQLRFVHNNAVGSAYIDQIKINTEMVLAVKDAAPKSSLFSLSPNPASDFIKINSSQAIGKIRIYEAAGKEVNVILNKDVLDIRGLTPGVYLINVKTDNQNFTEKFIKK
ncbi:T9SS type A sorting domain-containing protein [Chryseobacterium gallinarum]|uniref:T9SS type A sorting domain-containing protein n=1 Tax=Chryseobacterium gallinarum TaxID=1324352 RepID=UPI0020240DE4|nr:T9SS type A sorting domain-containing protein [Chryseobacterium gallinarum]MCL8538215.1 T9SS type A sorting domain-containing protein [Chryseobacterium gallinarum]